MSKLVDYYNSDIHEESEILRNRLNVLKCPIDILTKQEIDEINNYFKQITDKFNRIKEIFEEKQIKENFSSEKEYNIALVEYKLAKEKYYNYEKEVQFYNEKYFNMTKKNPAIIINTTEGSVDLESISVEGGESSSIPSITKIFLNSVITTQHIFTLRKKKNLVDERKYLCEIMFLKYDYPEDQILIDFYMSVFSLTIKHEFSLEKTSTFFSIMYFIFNYSILSKKIIKEKSFIIFKELLDFHCLHRPPYCYQVFDENEKKIMLEYAKNSFFRNYSLFENIFKYNVNIYLTTNKPSKITSEDLPKSNNLQLNYLIENINDVGFSNFLIENYINHRSEDEIGHEELNQKEINVNYEIEKYRGEQMDKLKTYMSSFYSSVNKQENNENDFVLETIGKSNEEKKDVNDILENKIITIKNDVNNFIHIEDTALNKETDKKIFDDPKLSQILKKK